MISDPILDEIHAIRADMAREAGYDLHEIAEQARRRAEAVDDRPTVQHPPRPVTSTKLAS